MKTKVLLIGPAYFNYNHSIASAFDPQKFEVRIIDYSEQFGRNTWYNKISYFFSKNKKTTTEKLQANLNKYIREIYNHYRPELVFFIKGDCVFAETVLNMKQSKKILWMLDGISYYPLSLKLVDNMDAVFLFEKSDVEEVIKLNENTFYLPPSFDDQIFKKLQIKKDIDILFIGVLYDSRIKLLEKLHASFPHLKMKFYCKRFWFYKTPLMFIKSLRDYTFINRFVTPIEANNLYNRAKVCLNMHHEQSVYGINPRFFEILGANALQFVDYKPFIVENFADYNIQMYRTEEELFQLIHQQFSENTQQDNQTLFENVSMHHTYKNRIKYILGKI